MHLHKKISMHFPKKKISITYLKKSQCTYLKKDFNAFTCQGDRHLPVKQACREQTHAQTDVQVDQEQSIEWRRSQSTIHDTVQDSDQ